MSLSLLGFVWLFTLLFGLSLVALGIFNLWKWWVTR